MCVWTYIETWNGGKWKKRDKSIKKTNHLFTTILSGVEGNIVLHARIAEFDLFPLIVAMCHILRRDHASS